MYSNSLREQSYEIIVGLRITGKQRLCSCLSFLSHLFSERLVKLLHLGIVWISGNVVVLQELNDYRLIRCRHRDIRLLSKPDILYEHIRNHLMQFSKLIYFSGHITSKTE